MDEIKAKQDSSVKDSSVKVDDSTLKEPQTFTEEQVTTATQKAVSDALAAAGRTAKTFEAREQTIKVEKERVAQERKERDEAELESYKDDPEKLSATRERQKRREAEVKLADSERELENERERNKEVQEASTARTKEQNAHEIATRLNVDKKTLLKFTDGSKEVMEELANSLPPKGEKKVVTADSSKTSGAGTLTVEQVKKMSPAEQMERADEIAKIPLGLT